MSEVTTRHQLPFIMPAQAQKHVTHNEALRQLDFLTSLEVIAHDVDDPPANPQPGDCYTIGSAPSGVWSQQAGYVASFTEGAWLFAQPFEGLRAYDVATQEFIRFDGIDWQVIGSQPGNPDEFGVNTSPDTVNRFSVKSDAVLISHDDVTPGSGDIRLNLNKASQINTASIIFQTGFSARAEFGLTGEDNWSVKVSADGATWNTALSADAQTGQVMLENGLVHSPSRAPFQGFLDVDGPSTLYQVDQPHGQNPRSAQILAVSGDEITLSGNIARQFFTPVMQDVCLVRVWNTSKTPQESAWVRSSPSNTQLTVSSSSDIAGWTADETIQIGDPLSVTPGRVIALDISPLLIAQFGHSFRQSGLLTRCMIAGDNGQLNALQTVSCDTSPTGMEGSFHTHTSNNQGVASEGFFYIPCRQQSPISNSNLVFIRQTSPINGQTFVNLVVLVQGVMTKM